MATYGRVRQESASSGKASQWSYCIKCIHIDNACDYQKKT